MRERRLSNQKILGLLAAALVILAVASVVLGRYPISMKELAGIVAGQFLETERFWTPTQEALLLNHRLPRIVLACLVGACLSAAGSAYQGVFHNPMSAPDILGASSGAAFGAALAILWNLDRFMIMAAAFVLGLLTVIVVTYIGNRAAGNRVIGLVLSGIMVSSLVSSGTSFIKLMADPNDQLPAITYWLMGSLNGTMPEDVGFVIIPMAIGLGLLLLLRWRINILTLGDDEAVSMGVDVKKLRAIVMFSATLITAASVSVSGMIGWVGLVVPHMARRLVGNNYDHLMPASMLLGAGFLLLVDDISRNLMATEIPIGILTSFVGAPFFIYLITRRGESY